jgi:hypothetical protein
MTIRRLIWAVVILFLIVALLVLPLSLVFDFHISQSQTNTSRQVSISRSVPGESQSQLPQSMQGQPALVYSVRGESRLAGALRNTLGEQLDANPVLGDVMVLEPVSDFAHAPYLILEIQEANVFWIPFYATSNVQLNLAFASDGDVSFRNQSEMSMQTEDRQPLIRAQGQVSLTDRSWGLLSRPAYFRLISESFSAQINQALDEIFQPK